MSSAFPLAFEARMKSQLGEAWTAFASAHVLPAPVSIRTNPFKSHGNQWNTSVPWTENGVYLPSRPVFTLDPFFHAGAYYVQEASSMLLEQAIRQSLPDTPMLRVLDLCAAPGGKSTHMLSVLPKDSLLVSNEVIRSRVTILSENIQKWGSNNVIVTNNDAEDFQRLPGAFDIIVVDAPCSGEGLFRKDPNAMLEWSPENVGLCSARQKRIIADVWPALKEGGLLIYSTCTYNEEEDEQNLLWLKEEHGIESIPLNLDPAWGAEEVVVENVYGYKCYPHKIKGEGFFIALIRKQDRSESLSSKKTSSSLTQLSPRTEEKIKDWVKSADDKFFILRDDTIQFFPKDHKPFLDLAVKNLRINFAGTFLGTIKHDKIIPEHALALSNELNVDHFFQVMLTEAEALNYLRRESLRMDVNHKGHALAMYGGLPLGWMNVIPGRINNLYPQEWRIRMSG